MRVIEGVPRGLFAVALALAVPAAHAVCSPQEAPPIADHQAAGNPSTSVSESPWLLAPIFSSNPKLGVSVGALGGYLVTFDEKSRPSMFALGGQYTSTDSVIAAAFAKTSFDEDNHRLLGGVVAGRIKNDYQDYLGTGVALKTDDNLNAFVSRYLNRVAGDWFLGVQGVYTNYEIVGNTMLDQEFLDFLGLKGFRSGGLGLVALYDTRDNDNSPTRGVALNLNNISYREWLGGKDDFDTVRLDLREYIGHGDGNVFAMRQSNQWTFDAPPAGFAPINLRGYTMGEYLGQYMSAFEFEERYRLAARWTVTAFTGFGILYGDGVTGSGYDNTYPTAGGGVQYLLKEKEGVVLNAEFAVGKDGNYGFYIRIGYGF
jgi:hypothetical protein